MIGKNIKRIRKKRGLTLTELASRAGIAKSYLSNIERNLNKNPSLNVIDKIAAVLEVDLNTLVGPTINLENKPQELSEEWIELINDLKKSGIEKEQVQEYRKFLEFIKWKKDQEGK